MRNSVYGPMIMEIWGTTPEAVTFLWKMSA